jgi:alkanesulfonate monooxygenase SsuD/methylene tetrahydromethanopterin reductase-like flavin-dependent oxidoreductase (luciferase family)
MRGVRKNGQKVIAMQFGIFGSAQASTRDLGPETGQGFRDYLEYATEAEALGYRSSFLVEHHFTGWNQVSATLMLQTALAMRTTTLRLGTAVIVLPWHNPVLLAEQAATLDLVSGGRLDFGVGKGYRHNEFAGFCIPQEEAEPRFEESIEVMIRSWTSRERFSHRGRFWQFDDIVVEPPPAQRPYPPLWVAAGSEASIRRAAKRGFNLILDQYASPAVLGERIALYRAGLEAQALRFNPIRVAVARQLYVANDQADMEAALQRQARWNERTVAVARTPDGKAGSHILAYAATSGGTVANTLFGTPDEIGDKLEALHGAGVEYVLLTILGGTDQLRRFAREVMPAFAGRPSAGNAAAVTEGSPA